jgi:integrase
VKNILEGAKRKLATPTVKKEPITPELLSLMYNSNYKENDLFSQRTICACLLAYAGFLRVSELLQIRRSDITFEATYICIFVPNNKTDIYRDGNSVVIVGTDSNLCPAKNLELYLVWGNILADSNEFIFRILTKYMYILRRDDKALSYSRMRDLFIQAFQSFVPDIKKLVFIVYDQVVPQRVRI